jgi:hypothetical protein
MGVGGEDKATRRTEDENMLRLGWVKEISWDREMVDVEDFLALRKRK